MLQPPGQVSPFMEYIDPAIWHCTSQQERNECAKTLSSILSVDKAWVGCALLNKRQWPNAASFITKSFNVRRNIKIKLYKGANELTVDENLNSGPWILRKLHACFHVSLVSKSNPTPQYKGINGIQSRNVKTSSNECVFE